MVKAMFSNAHSHFQKISLPMAGMLSQAKDLQTPETIEPADYFSRLASSITSQQISVAAAATIWGRLVELLQEVTPENLLSKNDNDLRSVGLSRQKIRYLRALAEHADTDPQFLLLNELSDEDVITNLNQVVGIGRWTAEMFLIFGLARPDVFSYGDLGLMRSLEQHFNINYKDVAAAREIIEPLSPHRTTAALVLWHHKDR